MSPGESERCGAPTAQARSGRDSISHRCILSLRALNSNDVGYWRWIELIDATHSANLSAGV